MKRIATAIATTVFFLAGAGVAVAGTTGPPEVDQANATIQVGSSPFSATRCPGEDGITYITYRGNWAGGETDVTPGSTDYNLSGNWSVKGVVWTINLKTDRGIFRGIANLISAAGLPVYSGPITLVTQGLPGKAGTAVQARGMILGRTYTGGKADGGSLVANVEFQVGGGFSANGEFGSSMSISDLSVTTNNLVC